MRRKDREMSIEFGLAVIDQEEVKAKRIKYDQNREEMKWGRME